MLKLLLDLIAEIFNEAFLGLNLGKILVHRNPKELSVEFIFDIHMLVLLIMLLLLYDQLNPGKITIRRLPF